MHVILFIDGRKKKEMIVKNIIFIQKKSLVTVRHLSLELIWLGSHRRTQAAGSSVKVPVSQLERIILKGKFSQSVCLPALERQTIVTTQLNN